MYQALGRTVVKKPNGEIAVKVEILDDRTGQSAGFRDYSIPQVGFSASLRAAVQADLQALVAAETDAALSAAIVNVQLGSI